LSELYKIIPSSFVPFDIHVADFYRAL